MRDPTLPSEDDLLDVVFGREKTEALQNLDAWATKRDLALVYASLAFTAEALSQLLTLVRRGPVEEFGEETRNVHMALADAIKAIATGTETLMQASEGGEADE